MSETGLQRLKGIAQALAAGVAPAGETVRTLLSWFDAQRRGYRVVATIRETLHAAGLATDPDFEAAYIDSVIQFRPEPVVGAGAGSLPRVVGSGTGTVTNPPVSEAQPMAAESVHPDPSFRLSKLEAANNTPVSVTPDACLPEAVTMMLSHDYSQLPVMQSNRDVKGAISWKSIASRLAAR